MNLKKCYRRLLISSIFSLTFIFGATITVDQAGSGYTTISSAIDAASSNDTVYVKSGFYIEKVNINKQITLLGAGYETTTIQDASHALYISSSNVKVNGFTFYSSGENTVYVGSSDFVISNCVIDGIGTKASLYNNASGNVTVNNCVFRDTDQGVWQSSGTININNCLFYNTSSYAIYLNSSSGTIYCFNSIFINNNVGWYGNGSKNSYYNNYYNNSSYNITLGTGDITTDPKFTNIAAGYTLQSDSPCKDAGNPNPAYNDLDGSVNDIGLYGGANTWSSGPVISGFSASSTTVNQGTTITIQATGTGN